MSKPHEIDPKTFYLSWGLFDEAVEYFDTACAKLRTLAEQAEYVSLQSALLLLADEAFEMLTRFYDEVADQEFYMAIDRE